MSWIKKNPEGCIVDVQIQPQARKNEVIGLHNNRLKIKITSPPVDGKANQALIGFLATLLDLNKSAFVILKGETSRQKQILIKNSSLEHIEAKLIKRTTS